MNSVSHVLVPTKIGWIPERQRHLKHICSLLLELVSVSYNEHESLMQQSNDELWLWKHPWMSPAFTVSASFLVACP